MDTKSVESALNFSRVFVSIFIAVVLGIYIGWFLLHGNSLSTNNADWAAFGDYIGGLLNPVIAFFAFYWLTVSIRIQKVEMKETREALEVSSKAHTAQADAAIKAEQYTLLRMMFDKVSIELNEQIARRQSLMDSVNNSPHAITNLWDLDGESKLWIEKVEELNSSIDDLTNQQNMLIKDATDILTKHVATEV